MSRRLLFQCYPSDTSSSLIKACSLPNVKHRYLFFRNQVLHPSNLTFKASQNYIHIMAKAGSSDDESQASVPSRRPSSEWKQWVAGILFSIFIPTYTPKIGLLATFKNKIGPVVVTLVTMAEVVGTTTGAVRMLSGHMARKRLLNGLNLKKRAASIEELPTQAEEKAEHVRELIHQVENFGNSIEEMMDSSSPTVTSSSQETAHEDRLVKRFSKS